jgi:queuine tRNA-ribosyltransferase
MVVGTAASVKGMTVSQLLAAQVSVVLANTYHLALRPGSQVVRDLGGLARFMGWPGPTLTDSGGYQVFSLAKKRQLLPEGIRFHNHFDGREFFLTPELALSIQEDLGADIMMCLDDCPPGLASEEAVAASLQLTHAWAKRTRQAWCPDGRQALFGIVQGGRFPDFRRESVETLRQLDFPGYAIGGVAVGESREDIQQVVDFTAPLLPQEKPRYLMGVGRPEDILHGVAAGIDMFDCVMPTRHARHYQAFTRRGTLNLRNATYAGKDQPLEENCDCECCRTVSVGYLRHLAVLGELMASVWLTLHNVRFYTRLLAEARTAIVAGRYSQFTQERREEMAAGTEERLKERRTHG